MARRKAADGRAPLPLDLKVESILSPKMRRLLPSLQKLRADTQEAIARQARRRRRPHRVPRPSLPWFAVPVIGGERFDRISRGNLYTAQVCECTACTAILAEALRPRDRAGRGKARLLLIDSSAPLAPRVLIARGLAVRANNLQISRAWFFLKKTGSPLDAVDMAAIAAGHVSCLTAPVMTRAAVYLVSRLPAPTA